MHLRVVAAFLLIAGAITSVAHASQLAPIRGNSPAGTNPDLRLTLVDSPDPVTPGGTITYTAILTNTGLPIPARSDRVLAFNYFQPIASPSDLVIVSSSLSAHTCTNFQTPDPVVNCQIPAQVHSGASYQFTVSIRVNPGYPAGQLHAAVSLFGGPGPSEAFADTMTTVAGGAGPVINSLSISPASGPAGSVTSVQWATTNATSCTLLQINGSGSGSPFAVATSGTLSATIPSNLTPSTVVTFQLTCLGSGSTPQATSQTAIFAVTAPGSVDSTTRISQSVSGAQVSDHPSLFPTASADGRFVVFRSRSSQLVAGDTNGNDDIFLVDRLARTIERVNLSSSGAQAEGGDSGATVVSADGRYVAFLSAATNLVPNDTNGGDDIFVRDRATGTTTRVSVSSQGAQASYGAIAPGSRFAGRTAISADGSFVVFDTNASNLVANDTNGTSDVFVHFRSTGQTRRISVSSTGSQGTGDSYSSWGRAISANGRFVIFYSYAGDLEPGDTNGVGDAFVHDLTTGTTGRVSVNSSGQQTNGHSFASSISGDGRYVVFASQGTNLDSNRADTNGFEDVFIRDRVQGRTTRINLGPGGTQANGATEFLFSSISSDGQKVVFSSTASNLVTGDTNTLEDIFLYDSPTASLRRVNNSPNGVQAIGGASQAPFVSSDGLHIVFASSANNLVSGDTNALSDIFAVGPAFASVPGVDEPATSRFTLPIPNPPNASCPAGFFIATVDDGPGTGLTSGIYGVELLLDAPGTRLLDGGLNFGGLIDAGQPGFAGFNFTNPANEMQRISLQLFGAPSSNRNGSLLVQARIIRQQFGVPDQIVYERTANVNLATAFSDSINLTPGFYAMTVAPVNGTPGGAAEGTYLLSLGTSFLNRPGGGFQGGAVVGGYHATHPFNDYTGFAAFCLGTQHSTSVRVLSRPTYGITGAQDLRLQLLDAQLRVLLAVPSSNP